MAQHVSTCCHALPSAASDRVTGTCCHALPSAASDRVTGSWWAPLTCDPLSLVST